ncbi:MAG: gamma-glutamyl-gamma-aminobutyrate hydrolase family protein, partial [Thaumarchaeota archaeon]|nr:gamma-glutamyl-gamma-aminobutyrate hydrolase family protein [Nitrososphaerota archaeon]
QCFFFGGSLIQDLQSHTGGVPNHVGQPHKVIIRDLFGLEMKPSEFEVNSYHNQGVTTAVLSDQLKVFAISPGDGIIEGIIHPTHKVLGVQWHPERPGSSSDLDQRMLEHILRGSFWII